MTTARPPRGRVPRRAMTAAEQSVAAALARCSFVPGTWEKSFARAMGFAAAHPTPSISVLEALWLRRTAQRYRRQLPAELLATLDAEPLPPVPAQPRPSPAPGPQGALL